MTQSNYFEAENNQRKIKSLLTSVIILSILVVIVLAKSYPDRQGLGEFFSASISWLVISNFLMYVGVIYLLLRIFNIAKDNSNAVYSSIGTINLASGILAIVLFCSNHFENSFLHPFLLNALVGTLIFSDVILFDHSRKLKAGDGQSYIESKSDLPPTSSLLDPIDRELPRKAMSRYREYLIISINLILLYPLFYGLCVNEFHSDNLGSELLDWLVPLACYNLYAILVFLCFQLNKYERLYIEGIFIFLLLLPFLMLCLPLILPYKQPLYP
jgi:predicted Na+-dependent transporter